MANDKPSDWQTVSFARRRKTLNPKYGTRDATKEKEIQNGPGIGVNIYTKGQGNSFHPKTLVYKNKATGSLNSHTYSNYYKDKNSNHLMFINHSKEGINTSPNISIGTLTPPPIARTSMLGYYPIKILL